MVIMDRFKCKYCGKIVGFERKGIFDTNKYDMSDSCPECYDKYEKPQIKEEKV